MMKSLKTTGIAISLVSAFLVLALVAELYYLLWWKKRTPKRSVSLQEEEDGKFCTSYAEEGSIEAEFMRLHSLCGPPRFLFTIKEETKEDLDQFSSRKSSRGRSLSDVHINIERSSSTSTSTPYMTPLPSPPFFTPPLTPMQGFNPLFESFKSDTEMSRVRSSPPPKFKFMRDAEDKLYKKILTEEAMRVHRSTSPTASPLKSLESEDGSFITIVIGKNRDKSQVNPLPSPPSLTRQAAH